MKSNILTNLVTLNILFFIVTNHLQIKYKGKLINYLTLTRGMGKPFTCEPCLIFWISGIIFSYAGFETAIFCGSLSYILYIYLNKTIQNNTK